MITQDRDEVIDAAVEKLKYNKEIYECDKNEFRLVNVLKPSKDIEVKHTKEKQSEVKKMSGKTDLNKFERENDEGEKNLDDEVYDLTENDMPTQMFDGERISMDEILDKSIIVRDMTTRPSSFSEGDYAILQIEMDNELRVILTGSGVLVKQVKEKADRIPFRCKVIEQKSAKSKYTYYTLAPVAKSKQLPSF